MIVELTREAPCPGRLESLLDLVNRDGRGRDAQATRTHLAGCRRCALFVETLELETRLAARPPYRRSIHHRPAGEMPDTLKAMTQWFNEELSWRTERELADRLCRLADSVLRLDPEFDLKIHPSLPFTGDDGFLRDKTVLQRLACHHLGLSNPPDKRLGARSGKKPSAWSPTESLLKSLDRVEPAGVERLERRTTLVRSLLDLAHKLSGKPSGRASLVEANLEWFYGSEKRVPDLLENALKYSENVQVRGSAINNLALWHSSNGQLERAIMLNEVALAVEPGRSSRNLNSAIWNYLAGRGTVARARLRSLSRSPEDLCRRFPPRLTRFWVFSLVKMEEIPEGRARGLLALLQSELYGSDGAGAKHFSSEASLDNRGNPGENHEMR